MSHKFHAEKRKEKFYKLAKEQGYRSRAAFKLIQLNKKYGFLGKSKACIDLCAAPGGWLQIASKYMPVSSMIIGVDLLPIKPLPNVTTFVEDITTPSCRQTLKKQLQGWQVDLVLHDGAPNVGGGGSWSKDAYLQTELVLHSLKLASEFLVEGGTFVTKIFRSPDYIALTWVLKQFFRKVDVTKPVASRAASSEVFAVCLGYLAPKKIDPKMFDPAVVFQQQKVENKVLNVLTAPTKRKVNRQGYDEDTVVVSKSCSASKFVDTDNPSDILGAYNEIIFDQESEIYRRHAATTTEIHELFKDLKVLGRGDFARLIKWHKKMNIFKHQLIQAQLAAEAGDDDDVAMDDDVEEVDQEELRANQLAERNEKFANKVKKDKKKKHELKMKEIKRLALNANVLVESNFAKDESMFNLDSVKSEKALKALKNHDALIASIGAERFKQIIDTQDLGYASDDVSEDEVGEVDEGDDDWATQREKNISQQYDLYKQRKKIVTKGDKKKLSGLAKSATDAFMNDEEEEEEDNTDDEMDSLQRAKEQAGMSKANLKMLNKQQESDTTRAQKWFAQDAFAEIDIDDEQEQNLRKQLESNRKRKRVVQDDEESAEDADDDSDDYTESESESEDETNGGSGRWLGSAEEKAEEKSRKTAIRAKAEAFASAQSAKGVEKPGFEEVPALSDYTDDSDARAEILALGTKMLRKKSRNAIIESAYNKYAFNDIGDLPEWFLEEENRHNKAQVPITKQEVSIMKNYLKAVDARPIKKIAEAQARKKKRGIRKLEKAKIQADTILNTEGIDQNEKLKQIQKLYQKSKASLKEKPVKRYVVSSHKGGVVDAKNNQKSGGRGWVVRVDPRMKKDKRSMQRAADRKKKPRR